jgi:eukaryotic-like serine/threonine-protein kinase
MYTYPVPPEKNSDPAVVPNSDAPPPTTRTLESTETAGAVIGRYHLLQKIGEGGMGEVWLAEQKEPVRRRVALKLVKAGMNSREVIARFESERQALALMEHPAIAKVFDAGSTPQGAPYFVMEYVAGVPITAYCDNHRLSTRERLLLFTHVCEGVQHAHQKAIIHRDLKPSNILVTEVDGRPAPKIIDFGVAKALTHQLTADTMFTRVGALVGTPEYMSPEQALSSTEDIDTRTDVYSLGIILYELLAGAPPLELRRIAFDEFLRRLREDDAPKPSTRLRSQDPATSTEVARKRRTEPQTLAKLMRGDLDSIALKALEKDRARRYGSPSDLAADIARYLNNEAVLAVAPSAAYRARKFTRRHRWGLTTACAFALVLIAATIVSVRQSVRANREAAASQAVNDFLRNDLLAQASATSQSQAGVKVDPDIKVRTALDRAAARIGGKFPQQPEVEASIRETMGETYLDLRLFAEARRQLERALELRRTVSGPENLQTLKTMGHLARAYDEEGKVSQAEALQTQALQVARRVLGPDHPTTLAGMYTLAVVYSDQRKYAQAEALDNQVFETRRRVLGPEHPETLSSMGALAADYFYQRKYPQAEALESQVLQIRRRILGPDHPDALNTMNSLAVIYDREGKYPQAEDLDRQVLEVRRRVLGPEHPDTLVSVSNLGIAYRSQGKYAQAEAIYRAWLAINANNRTTLNELAWHLVAIPDRRLRRPQEALQLARRAVKGTPETGAYYNTLGLAEYRNGLFDEAIATLNRSVELNHESKPSDFFFLAMAHWSLGERSEAEHFFDRGAERARDSAANQAELRMLWGEAAELLGKPGPVPTLLEAQAEPQRVMESLKRGVAAGRFDAATLQSSADLAPLRGRADFQILLRTAH